MRLTPAELHARATQLQALLSPCRLCPRACRVDRRTGQRGACHLGPLLRVFCTNLHFGEEPPITGSQGSGTVFFTGCHLHCVFCQNFAFSHLGNGVDMSPETLAARMLELQRRGAHNINWVTPTAQVALAVEALAIARERGLSIPLVYNCSGYESVEVLRLLDGVVDVYLPDAKYASSQPAARLSGAPDYPQVNQAAIREMWRQVGPLQLDAQGIAQRGLLVRHLVLPHGLAETHLVLRMLWHECGPNLAVSLMHQYFPAHRAKAYPEIARRISWDEYEAALHALDHYGFSIAYIQEWEDDEDEAC
ncbi:MAG: radical SAM protein [bacterium]|nr:radical SAM protein [bacterium]